MAPRGQLAGLQEGEGLPRTGCRWSLCCERCPVPCGETRLPGPCWALREAQESALRHLGCRAGSGRQDGSREQRVFTPCQAPPEAWAHPQPLHRVPRVPFPGSGRGPRLPRGPGAPFSGDTAGVGSGRHLKARAGPRRAGWRCSPGLRAACPAAGWAFWPGPQCQDSAFSISPALRVPVCADPPVPALVLHECEGAHACPQPLRLHFTGVPDTSVGAAHTGSGERPCELQKHV